MHNHTIVLRILNIHFHKCVQICATYTMGGQRFSHAEYMRTSIIGVHADDANLKLKLSEV